MKVWDIMYSNWESYFYNSFHSLCLSGILASWREKLTPKYSVLNFFYLCVSSDLFGFFLFQIAEMYSFLPREAVTHFLMSCTDCQKRMHLGAEQRAASSGCHDNGPDESLSSLDTAPGDDSMHIDYSLPITTTYLKHMRSLGYTEEDALNPDREVRMVPVF